MIVYLPIKRPQLDKKKKETEHNKQNRTRDILSCAQS